MAPFDRPARRRRRVAHFRGGCPGFLCWSKKMNEQLHMSAETQAKMTDIERFRELPIVIDALIPYLTVERRGYGNALLETMRLTRDGLPPLPKHEGGST